MNLSPREIDMLTIANTGLLSQRRLARGLTLSYTESIALISLVLLEKGRDTNSKTSVSELMQLGRNILGKNQVKSGVSQMIHMVQVEICFLDGTKLVTVHNPICQDNGDLELALFGSFLPTPSLDLFPASLSSASSAIIPGQIITSDSSPSITLNASKKSVVLTVTNTSDRPIQVGSHYHFMECNPYLKFDRSQAYGRRLNILAGTAVRFEPSEEKKISLVPIGGAQVISGGNALCSGKVSQVGSAPDEILSKLKLLGFQHELQTEVIPGEQVSVSRDTYAHSFGPTTGDLMRLGDTNLLLEIEKDYTCYGDEVKFGGGKVIRDGLGQSSTLIEVVDTVITNAVIIDYSGIYKADIGVKNGFISGIGKAGNPDTMDNVTIPIGNNTEVIGAEGMIVTAGGIDCHVHFICPQLSDVALGSGLTTLIGGGTGPASGTCATTCTPSVNHLICMMQATDNVPINFGFTGKGNTSQHAPLKAILEAGAMGLKLHEDWGTTPACIDACLSVAEDYDIVVNIHTDTLNESCMCEGSVAAFKDRTIHTYHTEGAGGGHAPDIIKVCALPNVIPSSTNPSNPYTVNTIDEHLDMLMVCHHLDSTIKEDVAFAESRIRAETIAAEDILHDVGAISIMSSDSQAMGRIGEVISRTWQLAHKMKLQLDKDSKQPIKTSDNERIKRYIAKYTINPAIVNGISDLVGSVEVDKLADLVIWNPANFGVKPQIVIKGGYIAVSQMGDANASIPTPEPVFIRPMFGSSIHNNSYIFCNSKSADTVQTYNLKKHVYGVKKCRSIGKKDMKLNDNMPTNIEVDAQTHQVKVDGEILTCDAIDHVPLGQNYSIF